jgi:hypothetical protein
MPTYGYTSISPSAFFSGVKGNSTLYASTLGNHNFLGVETRPPGITAYLGPIGGDGAAVTSTGYVDVARFYFPGNTDNRDVSFTFAAVAVGGTGTIRATIDGTDTGTVSVTSANTYSIVITPTTSTDPSEVLIEGLVSAGQMNITNMGAQLRQVDVDLGQASSGFTYSQPTVEPLL